MHSLVSKDEALKTSMVHVGYLILKKLEKSSDARLSLTEVAAHLAKYGINQSRPMMFALIFLHTAGVIDFTAPYIYKVTE
ncbi:MAG: hypothetical protein CML13_03985 [Puniceicoccaceae bacterium]|nr:hypothetical protein [Puniceicoccaceae bacterium]|tara:strand:+ start:1246 stop:1485 length:240 start_codon:yes stop_codon:yes gene_type:complete